MTDQDEDCLAAQRCFDCGVIRELGHALCEDCAAKRAGWKNAHEAYQAAVNGFKEGPCHD